MDKPKHFMSYYGRMVPVQSFRGSLKCISLRSWGLAHSVVNTITPSKLNTESGNNPESRSWETLWGLGRDWGKLSWGPGRVEYMVYPRCCPHLGGFRSAVGNWSGNRWNVFTIMKFILLEENPLLWKRRKQALALLLIPRLDLCVLG